MTTNGRIGRRDLIKLGGGAAAAGALFSGISIHTRAKTVVSYGTPGSDVEDAAWKPVWEAFEKANPDMQVRYMPLGGNYGPEYLQNLQARIAANNAPDVFWIPVEQLAGWATRHVIDPIDDYVTKNNVDLKIFFPAHIAGLTYDKKLWGLPRDGAPTALYYNADMFDAAGVKYPDETWTWQTYLDAATKLTKRDSKGRAQQVGAARGNWVNWVWQNQGTIFNEDKTKCMLDQPAAVEALQFLQDLVIKHKVAASASDLADQAESDMFLGGRMAMYFGVRGNLGATCKAKFRFDAAVSPKGKVHMTTTAVGPSVLWNGSKNKDAAFKLMSFISSPDGERLKIKDTGFAFPSIKSLTEESWFKSFKCGKAVGTGIDTAFTTEIANDWVRTFPLHPKWPEIQQEITKQIDSLFLGEKPAPQIAQEITAAVDGILAKQ